MHVGDRCQVEAVDDAGRQYYMPGTVIAVSAELVTCWPDTRRHRELTVRLDDGEQLPVCEHNIVGLQDYTNQPARTGAGR